MASVKTDNRPQGMRNNFETAASHILPYDPVAKKRTMATKHNQHKSQIEQKFQIHPYKMRSTLKLTSEQKKELAERRESLPKAEKAKFKKNNLKKHKIKKNRQQISSIVAEEIKKMFSAVSIEQDEQHHVQAYIASMVQAVVSNSNQPNDNKERTPTLPLKVILDQSSRT